MIRWATESKGLTNREVNLTFEDIGDRGSRLPVERWRAGGKDLGALRSITQRGWVSSASAGFNRESPGAPIPEAGYGLSHRYSDRARARESPPRQTARGNTQTRSDSPASASKRAQRESRSLLPGSATNKSPGSMNSPARTPYGLRGPIIHARPTHTRQHTPTRLHPVCVVLYFFFIKK